MNRVVRSSSKGGDIEKDKGLVKFLFLLRSQHWRIRKVAMILVSYTLPHDHIGIGTFPSECVNVQTHNKPIWYCEGRALEAISKFEFYRAAVSALEEVFPGSEFYHGLVCWSALTLIIYHFILATVPAGDLMFFGFWQAFSLSIACPIAFELTIFLRWLVSHLGFNR
jgi:hypothetical protein